MEHLLLLCLLFLSLQAQARESHFFSKASRSEASTTPIAEDPSVSVLPPQSRNGYGLYGDLRHQSRPTTEYREQSNVDPTIPSRPTTEYREQSNVDTTTTPSAYSNEFSNQEVLPSKSYENREPTDANTFPSSTTTSSDELSYETKEPNYSYNKEYGMSDTRFVDNGKYFYDLNAEGKQTKENAEVYRSRDEFGAGGGNYGNGGYVGGDGRNNMYKNGNYGNGGYVDGDRRNNMYENEMEEYRNNQANFGNQEGYVP
ncbi:hypothetical protein M6B38_304695 [Iris pallida]|uniref:Protein E6-like n=1 Tax=Iris pallida TaxID=29817 RepID=A0AAX6HKT7_IRIPA|nr:hypothetical protein M6B38_304695 [Iris pallida]